MARREQNLEYDGKYLAEALGWLHAKASGRNGVADDWFMKEGRGFVVEFKREKIRKRQGKQSEAQKKEQRRCEKRGVPYYLVESLDQMRKILLIEEAKLNAI